MSEVLKEREKQQQRKALKSNYNQIIEVELVEQQKNELAQAEKAEVCDHDDM